MQEITEAAQGIPIIIKLLKTRINFHETLSKYPFADKVNYVEDYSVALIQAFSYFCQSLDKPLVVLFDEVDCLSNGTLISFLRQLRDGYISRINTAFNSNQKQRLEFFIFAYI